MKRTELWPGVSLTNRTGKRILIQWRTLPDGTKMALIMGEGSSRLSGSQEIGFFGAIAAAAPAIFSMAKKVAPGLMKKAGDLASKVLPGPAAKMLQSALSPAAAQAKRAVAKAGRALPAAAPVALKVSPGLPARPVSSVRHITSSAPVPKGYTKVVPVMKIEQGAFVD